MNHKKQICTLSEVSVAAQLDILGTQRSSLNVDVGPYTYIGGNGKNLRYVYVLLTTLGLLKVPSSSVGKSFHRSQA